MEDRCVCCGEIIPEGQQVCTACKESVAVRKPSLSYHQCKIIIGLADNGMNVSEAARNLYMHRNTVAYHIERIKKITGKNPLDFWDLCELTKIIGGERGTFRYTKQNHVEYTPSVKDIAGITDKAMTALELIGRNVHMEEETP